MQGKEREDEGVRTERQSEEAGVEKETVTDSRHPLCAGSQSSFCCSYIHVSVGSSEACSAASSFFRWLVHSEG